MFPKHLFLYLTAVFACAQLEGLVPRHLQQLALQNAAFQEPFLSEQKPDFGNIYPK